MLEHMLSPLMPNSRELLERAQPYLFDEDCAADLALLHAIGVLGSMRESELALYFRGQLVPVAETQGYADEFAVVYPACNGQGEVTSESAVHATRRRLRKLVERKLLAVATVARTTSDHLAGRYYWLTRSGARCVLDAGCAALDDSREVESILRDVTKTCMAVAQKGALEGFKAADEGLRREAAKLRGRQWSERSAGRRQATDFAQR